MSTITFEGIISELSDKFEAEFGISDKSHVLGDFLRKMDDVQCEIVTITLTIKRKVENKK